MKNNMYHYEQKYNDLGYKLIAGVDEVGRGCIAGPLVVASCILPINYRNDDIKDSKQLTFKKREELFDIILNDCIDYNIQIVEPRIVDKQNPKQASRDAMVKSILEIKTKPDFVLIDYEKIDISIDNESIVKGDSKSISIAAASILAKVIRDRIMIDLSNKYNYYGFEKHKGYGTKIHLDAIKKYGPIESIHRFSYKPVYSNIKK